MRCERCPHQAVRVLDWPRLGPVSLCARCATRYQEIAAVLGIQVPERPLPADADQSAGSPCAT